MKIRLTYTRFAIDKTFEFPDPHIALEHIRQNTALDFYDTFALLRDKHIYDGDTCITLERMNG